MDSIMIDNHEVRSTECLKLLGVCIDNNLRFDEHISSISKKSAQRVGVLMRLRNLIPLTAAWLAQLGERRSTEREVAGSNPGRTNTQGL